MVTIRAESTADIPSVRALHQKAFGRSLEADLVDALRAGAPSQLSLVAETEGQVVGHILFTPVVGSSEERAIEGMGLAPMAVLPGRQRQGIGSRLVEQGLERLREDGCPFVVVLGHPHYYPRFGFIPASQCGLTCQWEEVPDDVFMGLVLSERDLEGFSGTARYREEFERFG